MNNLVHLGDRPTDPKMPLEEITADVLYPIAADWTSHATAAKLVNALMTAEEESARLGEESE